jgi:lipoprotein NlpI
VIARDPYNPWVRYFRALVHMENRAWKDALPDLNRAAELGINESEVYVRLWIWICRMHLGETEAAKIHLTQYLDQSQAPPGDWGACLVGYLIDTMTQGELFAAANGDPEAALGRQCEAWYFSGMKELFSGNRDSAAVCFRNALKTEKKDYIEYFAAERELEHLDHGDK